MQNYLFSSTEIDFFMSHDDWHIIASGLPEEVSPVRNSNYERWARQNEEVHAHREVLVVLSGGGYQRLCGKTYPLSPRTAIFFNTNEPHSFEYSPDHFPAEHLWFYFLPDLVYINRYQVGQCRRKEKYERLWDQAYPLAAMGVTSSQILFPDAYPKAPPEAVRFRCLSVLEMLISSIIEKGYYAQPTSPQEDFQVTVIRSMVKHIQETYGRNCHLETLASLAGYSPCHFSRLFAKHAGMSLPECVNAARAVGFQQMLAERKSLKSIAVELGFSHPSSLSRWRRQQGI